jgi:hypothetical protein
MAESHFKDFRAFPFESSFFASPDLAIGVPKDGRARLAGAWTATARTFVP